MTQHNRTQAGQPLIIVETDRNSIFVKPPPLPILNKRLKDFASVSVECHGFAINWKKGEQLLVVP